MKTDFVRQNFNSHFIQAALLSLLVFCMVFFSGCSTLFGSGNDQEHYRQRFLGYDRYKPTPDIAWGMEMKQVSNSWGEPGDVHVAGDPREKNEKWVYREGLNQTRIVYFENGRVSGWETK